MGCPPNRRPTLDKSPQSCRPFPEGSVSILSHPNPQLYFLKRDLEFQVQKWVCGLGNSPLKFQNRWYGSHQPIGMRLPSFSLIPRFMALGFTNSVQIRAGIDYTGFSPLDPSRTKLGRRTRDFVIRICEEWTCTFHTFTYLIFVHFGTPPHYLDRKSTPTSA